MALLAEGAHEHWPGAVSESTAKMMVDLPLEASDISSMHQVVETLTGQKGGFRSLQSEATALSVIMPFRSDVHHVLVVMPTAGLLSTLGGST